MSYHLAPAAAVLAAALSAEQADSFTAELPAILSSASLLAGQGA